MARTFFGPMDDLFPLGGPATDIYAGPSAGGILGAAVGPDMTPSPIARGSLGGILGRAPMREAALGSYQPRELRAPRLKGTYIGETDAPEFVPSEYLGEADARGFASEDLGEADAPGFAPAPARVAMPETTIGPADVAMPETTIGPAPAGLVMPETTIGPAPAGLVMPETTIGPAASTRAPVTVAATAATRAQQPAALRGQAALNPFQALEAFQVGALGKQAERLTAERAGLEATTGQRRAGQEAALEAERAALAADEEQASAEADVAIEEETLARQQVGARRRATEAAATSYADAQKQLANTTIDVEKAYGGTAGRLFAGLAVALGSFGASLTGGPNYALQVVNDRINRELESQRAELDKAKGRVTELGRAFERNEKLLGDAEAARKLTTAQTYTALRNSMAKSNAVQAAGPRGQMLLAELDQRTADAMAAVNARLEDVNIRKEGIPLEAAAQRFAAELERKRKASEAAAAFARSEKAKEAEQRREIEKLRVKGEEERTTEATKVALAEGGIPGTEPGAPMTPKQEKAVAEGQETLVKGIEKLGVKQPISLNTTLDTLENVLDRYGKEYEGMTGIAKRGAMGSLPPAMQTQQFKEYEQAIMQAFQPYVYAMTGAAAPESQMRQIEAAMGLRDPVALRRWATQQREMVRRAEETAALAVPARYRPTVLQSYRGTTTKPQAPASFTEMAR